jgi:hypothetical protein
MLPASLAQPLRQHLACVKRQHDHGLAKGYGYVDLPYALVRKYPNANREWVLQYIFPSRSLFKGVHSPIGVTRFLDAPLLGRRRRRYCFLYHLSAFSA